MTTTSDNKIVLLVGATGNLGGLIARALLAKSDVQLRCLVRPGSRDKAAALTQAGAQLCEGDLHDAAALQRACEGAYAVVSAVQGGPDVIIDSQLALLKAAASAGVRRFIPSDYSFDFFDLAEGDNINSDWRRAFARAATNEQSGVEVVHVLNGCFLDRGVLFGFLGLFDLKAQRAGYWGDGNAPMNFTTYADTARYTAEAATVAQAPERFYVAGDTLDFHHLVKAYEEGSGRTLTVERRGSLSELDALLASRRAAQPQNVYAWLPLMYLRAMLAGKGKLGELQNTRFPHIQPTTVVEYVRTERL